MSRRILSKFFQLTTYTRSIRNVSRTHSEKFLAISSSLNATGEQRSVCLYTLASTWLQF